MSRRFDPVAWEDYLFWLETDPEVLKRVNHLIGDCPCDPFKGIGKSEPLQRFSGWLSCRSNYEHRMINRVTGKVEAQQLEIVPLPLHFS